jgi:sodium bile acid symporter family protein
LVGGALGAAGFVASADQRAGGAPDCELLPGWLGLKQSSIDFSMAEIVKAVAIFLAVPLVAGCLTRRWGEAGGGREWYETRFLPKIGPVALWGLLFTVVLLFALHGERITNEPLDVARIALPLVAYFALMWTGALWLARRVGLGDHRATTVAFMAAGNNFELAIAVAISVFGVTGRYGEPGTTFLCRDLRPSGLKVRSICRLSWVMSDHALVGRARAKVWVAGSSEPPWV